MAEQPKISIIIVTYNAAQTLQACLNSIYAQRYPAIEIVLIDGKSNDGTVEIIQQNADKLGYWVSEEDAGIYDAMNKGLKHATGEWIYFLGADDVLFDGFSDLAIELRDKSLIYYGRVMTLGGPTIPADAYAFAKYGLCHQAMIYPREVFNGRPFNTRYKISADYAFNITLFNSGEFTFVFKDHLVANFNQTGVSSTSIDRVFEADRSQLVRKYFGTKIWMRFMFWRFKRRLKGVK